MLKCVSRCASLMLEIDCYHVIKSMAVIFDCYEILDPFSTLEGHLFGETYNEDFMCKRVFIAL